MASGTAVIDSAVTVMEGSSHEFSIAITDDGNSDASVTPDSATWSLYDNDGAIVNSRTDVALTPGTSMSIVTSGSDNTIVGDRLARVIFVKAVCDLEAGNDLPMRWTILYNIVEAPA